MYKSDVEAMPRAIKEELINTVYAQEDFSIDDIISLEKKRKTKHNYKEIRDCITPNLFPNFWITTEPAGYPSDNFFIVFITSDSKGFYFRL